jgi:hypothetical protein
MLVVSLNCTTQPVGSLLFPPAFMNEVSTLVYSAVKTREREKSVSYRLSFHESLAENVDTDSS